MVTKIQFKKPFIKILFRPDVVLNLSTFAFFMDTTLSLWASIYIFCTFAMAAFEITVIYRLIAATGAYVSTYANTSIALFSFHTCGIFTRICENSFWIYLAVLVSKYFKTHLKYVTMSKKFVKCTFATPIGVTKVAITTCSFGRAVPCVFLNQTGWVSKYKTC